jgi:hypothetical protein
VGFAEVLALELEGDFVVLNRLRIIARFRVYTETRGCRMDASTSGGRPVAWSSRSVTRSSQPGADLEIPIRLKAGTG